MTNRNPAKRIPKSLKNDSKIFGPLTISDLTIAALPGILVIFIAQMIVPSGTTVRGHTIEVLTLPAAMIGIFVGLLLVYLTPSYMPTIGWFLSIIGFYRDNRRFEHQKATKLTQVKCIHPEFEAVERIDGAFIGIVQVVPPTMALATDDEWEEKAVSFQEFLNTVVDFPIQIYSTTRDFPTERYLSHYETRLSDTDVKRNSQLRELIEHYIDWYRIELERRHMTIRQHFVIVPVSPNEVHFEYGSITEKLVRIPIFGLFISTIFSPDRLDEQLEMADALSRRLRRVESGLREIDGCSATRLSVEETVNVIGRFWENEAYGEESESRPIPKQPLVTREVR